MTGLDHETPPPPHLKGQVMAELRQRGLLRGRRTAYRLMRIAAAFLIFFAGVLSARLMSDGVPQGRQWLLLLYEDSTFAPQSPINDLVAEYSRWAHDLREEGKLAYAEKLGSGSEVMGGVSTEQHSLGELSGFFVLVAPDEQTARSIALSSPHLRHGGRVVLRPIEGTE